MPYLLKSLLILYLLCLGMPNIGACQSKEKTPIVLDADTGNEVDDYYALARAFIEPSWDILCLNATQWQSSQWAIPETMENSHRLNQVLVREMEMNIKTNRGGVNRMFDWGDMAQHSAAAYEIIKLAKGIAENEKLTIIALGALTNIASAMYIDPSIESKIRLYWLGTTYDYEKNILKRQDFNCMMDQQAIEMVLLSNAELHIMPVNVAMEMVFNYEETTENLPQKQNLSKLLLDRWFQHLDGGRKERTIWDLALVQSILYPEWTEQKTITTSKDYGNRIIHYYLSIHADKMKEEFFRLLNEFLTQK